MVLSCEIITRSKFLLERGSHPSDAIIIVLEGSFFCETHDQAYTVGQNELFFFKSNEPFQRRVLSPMTAIYIVFDALPFPLSERIIPLYPTRTMENIQFLFQAISEDHRKQTDHFINDLLYCCSCHSQKTDPLVWEIVQYMKENYSQNISLERLASTFNMSKQWLIRRFKKDMHITPITYLNHLRIKKAKELLLQPEMTVKEVAFACGFETPYYFTNVFKKYSGSSPAQWRKRMLI